MRSVLSIVPLLPGSGYSRKHRNSRLWPFSGVGRSARLAPLDRFHEHAFRLFGIAPVPDADPLLRLQILVMGKEVLDLLAHDLGQVLGSLDLRIIWKGRVHRHRQQLLVAAMLVLEEQHGDDSRAYDA